MIRLNANKLKKKDDKYFFNGSLFSGVLFFLQGDIVLKKRLCQDGIMLGDYKNKLFPDNNYLEINFDALIGDDPYYPAFQYFNDKEFTGIAYGFNQDGFCTDEILFVDGLNEPKSSIDFSVSGEIISFDKGEDEFSQLFEWDKNNIIKHLYLTLDLIKNRIDFEIKIKNRLIRILTIDKGYFENIENFRKYSVFTIFEKKSFLENISANDDFLYLSGLDIDDEIFYYLHLNNGLKKTKVLNIRDTSLTDESFKKLIGLKNLEDLNITSYECSLEVVDAIKKHNPTCKISLNTKEILLS